jgi:hypothetical protein
VAALLVALVNFCVEWDRRNRETIRALQEQRHRQRMIEHERRDNEELRKSNEELRK